MIDAKLIDFVSSCNDYVITFHQNPDGDAIGSGLALHLFLRKLGKRGVVVSPNAIGDYLKWLPDIDNVLNYEDSPHSNNKTLKQAGAIFCLDFNDPNRAGELENSIIDSKAKKVLIDHHLEPKKFAQFEYHDTQSPATAQLIFNLISEIDESMLDAEIATCLYTGLMTDTGSFRFPSTNAQTHLAISKLMQTGFNHAVIHENIFDTYTENQLHLLGNTISQRHEIISEFSTSYMYVTLTDYETYNIQKGDTEGLVNYNLQLEGVNFGVLFIENEEMVKISFRSKGDFPANEFAKRYFQGGGHLNAAGGRSFISLERTIKRFKSKLKDFVEEFPIN
ncbi:MAG: bifunctional oligoribonuclease/PAP phosphatase NrnA [Bacteroidia bacterium]